MACRVGMSTRPLERIDQWKRAEGYVNGRILAENLTYDEALRLEQREAHARGCNYQGGGERVEGRVWSIYIVWN